jgi:hypothetical protein
VSTFRKRWVNRHRWAERRALLERERNTRELVELIVGLAYEGYEDRVEGLRREILTAMQAPRLRLIEGGKT